MIKALVGMAILVAACGGGDVLSVEDARIGEPTGPNAALYLTISSDQADELIGASTEVALVVHLHETRIDPDGTIAMIPVDELQIPENGDLVLEPGGPHLMLIDVDHSIVSGDTVEVTLNFLNAGEVAVTAVVVDPGDTVGHDGHDG